MAVKDLEAINQASREALRARRNGANINTARQPYYGYVDVDIFDCPPFLMFTNNDSPVVDYILNNQTFESHSMSLWCHLCRSATGIVDVGANVGIYSLSAALLRPELEVHAFEPNPYAFSRLRMHKAINHASNIVEHTIAAGQEKSLAKFSWIKKPNGSISSGGGLGPRDRQDIEEIWVETGLLDEVLDCDALGCKPLIKIDVEGGEYFTVQGMSRILELKPDIILETFSQHACDLLNEIFLPIGYSVFRVMESERRLVPLDRLHPSRLDKNHNFNQFLTVDGAPVL